MTGVDIAEQVRDVYRALSRLKAIAVVVSEVLDTGERDPTWHETQELECAALEYGRAVRRNAKG